MQKKKLTPGKGASGKSKAPDVVKPPIMTPLIEGNDTLLSNDWAKYFDELSRSGAAIGEQISEATAIINIDGGHAGSVYAE